MIKDVISSSPFIQVTGGGNFTPYVNMSNASAGMIRFNGTTQNLEVYDGMAWMIISSSIANVGLTADAQSILMWAQQKMKEEQTLAQLSEEHPAVKIALDNLKRAEEQLDVTIILSKEHEKTTS